MQLSYKVVLIVAVIAGMFGYSKGFERGYTKGMKHKEQLIPRPADKWPLIPFLRSQIEPLPLEAQEQSIVVEPTTI